MELLHIISDLRRRHGNNIEPCCKSTVGSHRYHEIRAKRGPATGGNTVCPCDNQQDPQRGKECNSEGTERGLFSRATPFSVTRLSKHNPVRSAAYDVVMNTWGSGRVGGVDTGGRSGGATRLKHKQRE